MTEATAKTLGEDLKTEIAHHAAAPVAQLAGQMSQASAWIRAHPRQAIAAVGLAMAMAATLIAAAWRATFTQT